MPNSMFSVFRDERFMDLTLYQYGYEACKPLHSFGPYVRNHYLFHYVISGKGTLRANDRKQQTTVYSLQGGQGFLIEPGYVNMYAADEKRPWEYIWVEFGGLRAKEFLESAGLSSSNPVYKPTLPEEGTLLQEEMFAIVDSRERPLAAVGHLYLLMDLLISTSASRKEPQGGRLAEIYVRDTMSYIGQNYTSAITVEDLAMHCKLDRSYFGKIFKSVVGCSPQEFLIQYRMAKGADILKMTDISITEVGTSVGYPNLLHFSRAFKSVYGISPREYRQRHRNY